MTRLASREPIRVELEGTLSLSDLLWVANTRHGPAAHWFARPVPGAPAHDHLRDPADAVAYLAAHGVRIPRAAPADADLIRLGAIREMVRGLPLSGGWTSDVQAILAETVYGLDQAQRLRAKGTDWSAFVGDLVLPLLALLRGPARLSECANPRCRLMYLDSSRNRTRRWCDTGGCGNRERVRRHRAGVGPLDSPG